MVIYTSVCRCCCGRPENQHDKLTTVQEENEEIEMASDAAEDSADNSEPEDEFETDGKVKFVKIQGWCKSQCLYCTSDYGCNLKFSGGNL